MKDCNTSTQLREGRRRLAVLRAGLECRRQLHQHRLSKRAADNIHSDWQSRSQWPLHMRRAVSVGHAIPDRLRKANRDSQGRQAMLSEEA